MWRALLASLLLASVADAKLILLSNFAAVTTTGNSFEFAETDGGSSTDAMITFQTTVAHNAAAGGTANFGKPMKVDITVGGAARYISVFPSDISVQQLYLSIQAHDHNDVTQTGARELLEYSMNGTRGCYLVEGSGSVNDKSLNLYYNTTGTSWGGAGSTYLMNVNACQGDPLTGCVTPGADATCSSGTCGNCASNGECYWAGIGINQVNYPSATGDQVDCQLYINGTAVLSGLKTAASLAAITNIRIGAPATGETGNLRWYVGSIAVEDAVYAGHGWVAAAFPLTDGTTPGNSGWVNNSCTTRNPAGIDSQCVRDWTGTGLYDNNAASDTLKATAINKVEDLLLDVVTPDAAITSIPAVEMLMVGNTTNDNGSATFSPSFLSCSAANSCVATDKIAKSCTAALDCDLASASCTSGLCTGDPISAAQTTPILMSRFLSQTAGSGARWSAAELAKLGVRYADSAFATYSNIRMGGIVAYIRGRKADAPLPRNLNDHNIGVQKCASDSDCGTCSTHKCEGGLCTGDCQISCYAISDSRGFGTEQSSCIGGTNDGQFCSGATYCNNVVNAAGEIARDIPCANDASCATCVNRRGEANGGAGYPCASNNECTPASCPGAGCTCTGNGNTTCSQNDAIPCTTDSNCQGLGTCEVDPNGAEGDFCVLSCPNGTNPNGGSSTGSCPGRTGWPAFIGDRVNCDVIVSCYQGGDTLHGMVDNRWDGIAVGETTSTCDFAKGSGKCACTANADCGSGGACWCRNNSDCGTSGTCTIATGACASGSLSHGTCQAGDATAIACTTNTQCTAQAKCVGPPGDYFPIVMDVNDSAGYSAPECREPESNYQDGDPTGICHGPTTVCSDDTTCDTDLGGTVSPTSQCLGNPRSSNNFPCISTRAGSLDGSLDISGTNALCTAEMELGRPCKADANCASGKCLGTLGATGWYPGYCGCIADSGCLCTDDADCGGGVHSCNTFTGACSSGTLQWKCAPVDGTSTPGSSHPGMCRRKCSTDATCSTTSVSGACDTGKGVCKGRCSTPCDRTTCTTDQDCPVVFSKGYSGIPVYQHGECVSGRCAHCGPQQYDADANTKAAFARYSSALYGSNNAVNQLARLNRDIDIKVAARGGTRKPLVLYGTGIEVGSPVDSPAVWRGLPYMASNADRLLANPTLYPHVVDIRRVMQDRAPSTIVALMSFFVHFSPTGAQVVGGDGMGNYMAALNECAQTSGAIPTVQKYCRSSAGVYQTTGGSDTHGACTTSTVCTAGYSCTSKICTSGSDCPNTTDTCFLE